MTKAGKTTIGDVVDDIHDTDLPAVKAKTDDLRDTTEVGTPLNVDNFSIIAKTQVGGATGTITVSTAGFYRVRVIVTSNIAANGLVGGTYRIYVEDTNLGTAADAEHAYDENVVVSAGRSIDRLSTLMYFSAGATIAVWLQGTAAEPNVDAEVHILKGV